ncbi:MAG TPA: PAS domain S-box protein [Dissulfurispiraceae bacterium]|nr:PAS domain S-box protein [Dissulfurispiraceae bacterium]
MLAARLEKINACLLQLGEGHLENIQRLTALCGEDLGATCALYNRLEGDLLHAFGRWRSPGDFKTVDSAKGHICFDIIGEAGDKPVVITDLPFTKYAETDPNVLAYGLKTYLGHVVRCEGKPVGSLCTVYQTDFRPTDNDLKILGIIAAAIGHEDTRWKVKEALGRSVSILKATLESTADGILVVDSTGRIIDFNERFVRMWQIPNAVLASRDDAAALAHVVEQLKDPIGFLAKIGELYAQPETSSFDTIEFKDGRVIERLSRPQRLDNEVIGRVWSFRDITDRKRAEIELSEEKAFIENSLNTLNDALFVTDMSGRLLRWNKAVSTITEYGDSEIAHMKPMDFFIREDAERVYEAITRVIREGSATLEATVLTKSGQRIPYEYTGSLLKSPEGDPIGISGAGRNVTERKRLEEQLRQAQKMEAVGQLAGGIAHDFNNILSAIMGYCSLIQIHAEKGSKTGKYVEGIFASAKRAAELTASLLAFSRKQHIVLKPLKMNALIRDIHKLLSRIIGEDIELELRLSDAPLVVMADAMQIEHAVINLATNARDAMPEGGKITISTEALSMDDAFVEEHGFGTPGDYAHMTVTDTGTGMRDEHKEKIFEPFFTTKEVGKGTGLGLSMVYGTIRQHNGYVNVDSRPGEGSSFHIYLPLSEEREDNHVEPASVQLPAGNATETILLAEDEEPVRRIMKEMLVQTGYTVIEAADGEEALYRIQEQGEHIDLIIADIVMPKMNGIALYAQAKEQKTSLRFLFMSGYPDRIAHSRDFNDQNYQCITKPFTLPELLNKVRAILEN